jgi:putative membrane protein
MKYKNTPHILLAVYFAVFVICAISPFDREVWWAENIPVMIIVALLAYSYRYFQFTALSYVLMSTFLILHTIGGHYTFERVPFDFVSNLFAFERNHYDRLAHFSVGFYAYPIAELLHRKRLVRSRWLLLLFPLFSIVTVAGIYEVVEWQYAVNADEAAGIAVLGSQGDIWDAQKDILADTLGAVVALSLYFYVYLFQRRRTARA